MLKTYRVTYLFVALTMLSLHARAQTVILKPTGSASGSYSVDLIGSFNQWEMTPNSKMQWNDSTKTYHYSIPKSPKPTLFNVYKQGDWQNPLATEYGKPYTCGYFADTENDSSLTLDFHGWTKDKAITAPDTLVGKLITLNDFPMKSLERSGDIYIYLPNSYLHQPNRAYPVVYMLDGQNLFTEALSYSYEWQVDETLTATKLDIIVVGIANGAERWKEYNPWDSVNYMGKSIQGTGNKTIQFIQQELKPYIDKNYRTRTEAENTALIGSSLGGLMALYAGIEHSDTFGKVAAFSPSFSFTTFDAQTSLDPAKSNLISAAKQTKPNKDKNKIYFDVGEVEYGSFDLLDTLYDSFVTAGYSPAQLKMVKDTKGRHCELDWAQRLPVALNWLFKP
ncbi:hypothetical protein C2869_16395 [Saccharobesus litoralis]|uniref:Uncharacterized protein n=1 Tax=Saccharobesus litoralis TaxID=2172099 RepID=A0A2S0VUK7_9ALTE|nr:alpha/beta hydrolase-fold protein [Saccharobesus litoralis]AWB67906.1 hypothetical protein C2869_16395 [Saccharobesus litoralis]